MIIKNAIIFKTVQELLKKDNPTQEDLLSIKELDLQRKNLTEVNDLEIFVNLEKLNLTENCLSDLNSIKDLIHLKELRAGNDPFISDEEKTNRKGKNHFVNYSFLENLKNLTHVCFTDTDIDNVDFVCMLPNVIEFWAYCNPLKNIDPIILCQKLKKAYFYACTQINDISVCKKIPSLDGLAINATGVSDISPLCEHNNFIYLDAHDAKIRDISPVKNMVEMIYLTLAGNFVTDITPLLKMQKMKSLTLEIKDYLTFDQIDKILPELKGLKTVELNKCDFTKEQEEELKSKMPYINWDIYR